MAGECQRNSQREFTRAKIMKYTETIKATLLALVLALLLGTVQAAKAQQRVEGDLNRPQLIKGSAKELNLITVENVAGNAVVPGRIVRVDGPSFVEIETNQTNGSVLIMFKEKRVANLFVSTAAGNQVPLIITPEDIPLQKIVISEQVKTKEVAPLEQDYLSIPIENRIVALLKLMADDETNVDVYDVKQVSEDRTQWRDTRLTLIQRWYWQGLVGEVFEFSNLGNKPMVMTEEEFYLSGDLAVSVERLQLQAKQSTRLYRVREENR